MAAKSPAVARRVLLFSAAVGMVVVATVLGATWFVGSSVWPADETTVTRKFGTEPATIEAAVATGDPAADLRIGILGDIQNGISEFGDLLDSFRGDKIDFFLQLGDAANEGEPGRYAVLRRMLADHAPGVPVIAVPGNHDIEPDQTTTVWQEWVGPAQWRLDVRGWRILGIDDSTGEISAPSMELLRRAAADTPPERGTIVVAHRPLGAAEVKDGVRSRSAQLASTGLTPAMTFCGHWHANDTYADPKGTLHYLLGENCDRQSGGGDPMMSRATLVLGAKDAKHTLEVGRVPRRVTFGGEFLRLAVGQLYPRLREHPFAAWAGVLGAIVAAVFIARHALRS